MRSRTRPLAPNSPGFTMIELVVVVSLIVIMAAVALPNISAFIRQSKVRGATQQVAGEIQTARNKAIVKNVNPGIRGGVVFTIFDQNTYRFSVIDENFTVLPPNPPDPRLGVGPLRDLPQGLVFMAGIGTPVSSIGFDNLGRRCEITNDVTKPTCAWPANATFGNLCPEGNTRCTDRPPVMPGTGYMDQVGTDIRVRVQDPATGLVRTVLITQGGKVMPQR